MRRNRIRPEGIEWNNREIREKRYKHNTVLRVFRIFRGLLIWRQVGGVMAMRTNWRHTCLLSLSAWWDLQRRVMGLGSSRDAERETVIAWFVAQGPRALPVLRRALRGSVGIACGAAIALYRLGDAQGVRTVLSRCYDEEWLLRCLQEGYLAELRAIRCLGRGTVGAVLQAALDDAGRERDSHACMRALIVSLSAVRVLAVFEGCSPLSWWERAVRFGPSALRGLSGAYSHPAAAGMTAWIRAEAISRLLYEHRGAAITVLLDALQSEDRHVALSAIDGLQRLKDRRALPSLQSIAFGTGHLLAAPARRAVERIAGRQAAPLILMRAAQRPDEPGDLLRPASTEPDADVAAETLVRTVSNETKERRTCAK
jgi:hypothetical protein